MVLIMWTEKTTYAFIINLKTYLDKLDPYRWFEEKRSLLYKITEYLARLKIATQLG